MTVALKAVALIDVPWRTRLSLGYRTALFVLLDWASQWLADPRNSQLSIHLINVLCASSEYYWKPRCLENKTEKIWGQQTVNDSKLKRSFHSRNSEPLTSQYLLELRVRHCFHQSNHALKLGWLANRGHDGSNGGAVGRYSIQRVRRISRGDSKTGAQYLATMIKDISILLFP